MHAQISAIDYHLPSTQIRTEDLALEFPEWSVARVDAKTGIHTRYVLADDECASDLGVAAATKVFATGIWQPEQVDFLLFCSQTPDYILPTTACLLQDRLGIPTTTGALDFNLGCSGYVYGLALAEALIRSEQASGVLLITAESYSRISDPNDKSVRTIFSDGGAATLILSCAQDSPYIGPFVFGTNGAGGTNFIVRDGGMRARCSKHGKGLNVNQPRPGGSQADKIYMNGPELFTFAISTVPMAVAELLERAKLRQGDIELFVFHQANKYILDELRRLLDIPAEKFYVRLEDFGNTVSSSIPIALRQAFIEGRLRRGALVMVVGFGVGYSWAATLIRWTW